MESNIELTGITWNHTRGYLPMVATAQRFSEIYPEISITWHKRSLQQFADAPLADLASRFDLMVIDHPSVGEAVHQHLLLKLDEHLPAAFLADQAANSVGQSHTSYLYEGHQYVLAIDAATPVSGWRPDLITADDLPKTWDDLIALARRGLVAVPAIPIDSLMNLFMLANALGAEPFSQPGEVIASRQGTEALKLLRELVRLSDPGSLARNPIRTWQFLAESSTVAYCPFAYGYSNYSRPGYAANILHTGGLVSLNGKPLRSTLGGAGLAISRSCKHPSIALAYAQFTASPVIQRTLYTHSGGQPGHRSAWLDPTLNTATSNFFSNTLPTLDSAWVRPRFPGFIGFQDAASNLVHHFLVHGGAESEVLGQMNAALKSSPGMKPLEGLLVIDFSQFLSGPSASLRLADLGARVIKIERPGAGDLCRQLYISNLSLDGDSTLFHSINRNKESYAADLKSPADLAVIRKLLLRADVMIQNFRPGVIEKIGLGYDAVREINPRLIYGEVTGYGSSGPWRNKPGQDLLVQSLSGLPYLNGDAAQPPVPFGLAVADMMAGAHLVQGLLAALVRRGITGQGARVEVSLLESILDLQFEVLTTYLNDGGKSPERSAVNNAHAYLGAPYGIYATSDGYLALAMGSILRLGELLACPALLTYTDPAQLFDQRDEIKSILVHHLKHSPTQHWLSILEPADIWCADVLTWDRLFAHEGFQTLNMVQNIDHRPGTSAAMRTTRCPIRIDGEILTSPIPAPRIGEHNQLIAEEFNLNEP